MELLPILQGLSTPILLVIGVMAYRGMNALHEIDKRLAIVETQVKGIQRNESKIVSLVRDAGGA